MDDNAERYARLSEIVYRPLQAQETEAAMLGYAIDPDFTDANRTTFVDPSSGKAIIAFRGTQLTNLRDLAADAFIAAGAPSISPRFRTSYKLAKRVIDKYGPDNTVVTGHSLGGAQALVLNRKLGIESHAFNPGAGLTQQQRGIMESAMCRLSPGSKMCKNARNSTIYSTSVDPLSAFALYGPDSQVHVQPKQPNVHAIKNFFG
jgi:hypothetical protein